MASVTLGSLAEGSIVKIARNGSLERFYVAKQNYESTLNGSGRTLLVDWDYLTTCWWYYKNHYDEDAATGVNIYAFSDIDEYLNGTYLGQFSAAMQKEMGSTAFYYTPGNKNKTVSTWSRPVFALSGTELGLSSNGMNVEGTQLPIASVLRANCRSLTWTRSPDTRSTSTVWAMTAAGKPMSCIPNALRESWRALPGPAFTLPASLSVNDDGVVFINTAPSTPGSIMVPASVNGGSVITVSWTKSTDSENNLEGYIVQRSTDGGSSWTQIYQGSALSTTNSVAFGTASVMYRVKACDSEGLESGWRTSAQRTVLNNRAPTAPGSITVPEAVYGGGPLTVSWTAATDSDGNLSGYALERQADGGDWTEIYRGPALTCTDSVTRGWQSVAYRVRAYDSDSACSGYTASETRTVNNNYAPVITSETASGTDLGEKAEGFALSYQVTDADGDAVTVREYLDAALQRSYEAVLGGENTFQAVDPQHWRTVLNGAHTLKIIAGDGKTDSEPYTVAFTKAVHTASVTLETPMEADAEITVCALSVTGSIPADAAFKVEVTNNALDGEPVWEDCTAAVRNRINHVFANRAAANGFAFNFRLTVERGPGGQGGYITSIQGGFQ